eukprot:6892718-Ditylum_brightwellii.AAC.1
MALTVGPETTGDSRGGNANTFAALQVDSEEIKGSKDTDHDIIFGSRVMFHINEEQQVTLGNMASP